MQSNTAAVENQDINFPIFLLKTGSPTRSRSLTGSTSGTTGSWFQGFRRVPRTVSRIRPRLGQQARGQVNAEGGHRGLDARPADPPAIPAR